MTRLPEKRDAHRRTIIEVQGLTIVIMESAHAHYKHLEGTMAKLRSSNTTSITDPKWCSHGPSQVIVYLMMSIPEQHNCTGGRDLAEILLVTA